MVIDVQDDLLKIHKLGLLDKLLVDKTTKKNIIWATNAYCPLGAGYQRNEAITTDLIIGANAGVIKTRARKAMGQRSERTRQHGEVSTPLWICQKMNDHADEVWFDFGEVFFRDGRPTPAVVFPPKKSWKTYVDSRRLEIACGEAPYLVSRYDVETGEMIPIPRRIGLLDRKLRVVSENAQTEKEWLEWAFRAFRATYGYELQGDNVLIARVNLLMTFEEYLRARWEREPAETERQKIINIITWNIWQMDGLSGTIPYGTAEEGLEQVDPGEMSAAGADTGDEGRQPNCRIFNWPGEHSIEFLSLSTGENHAAKFDFIIGNPPYQDETIGEQKTFAPPIYHLFLDAAYQISDCVELIHPARFLFHAGSTPKPWNRQMLEDPHLKVLYYEQDAGKIFPNTEIKGGVAITYHDRQKLFDPVGVFCPYAELHSIMRKAAPEDESGSLMSVIFIQNRFDLAALYSEHPECRSVIGSDGRDKRFRNNIFDKISLFTESRTGADDVAVIGVVKNKRRWRYLPKRFIDAAHENFFKWKVLVVRVNGVGAAGEILSTPIVAKPGEGYTQTFIGIGAFGTQAEAENALKYVKTKFARIMLGILKITQDNNRRTWRMVPLQDFTPASDIDWSKSVPEIDRQLYAKYSLDEQEIEFVETHAKKME